MQSQTCACKGEWQQAVMLLAGEVTERESWQASHADGTRRLRADCRHCYRHGYAERPYLQRDPEDYVEGLVAVFLVIPRYPRSLAHKESRRYLHPESEPL